MCLAKSTSSPSSNSSTTSDNTIANNAHNNTMDAHTSAAAIASAAAKLASANSSNNPTPDFHHSRGGGASPPRSNTPPANSGSSLPYTPTSSNSHPALSPPMRGPPSPLPTLVPNPMSMVSMASMLGHPAAAAAAAGLPSFLPMGYPRDLGRNPTMDDFASSMHKFMDRSFGDSPPPATVPTNDPTANECKIVEYRGEKIAAFTIAGKTMLCLPQAFELFLKHLVGGLHTVYTKLKRLEITPIVCNVEQVRILRGLGAIQPGVNRCKLLADCDFDALYKDCTTSR